MKRWRGETALPGYLRGQYRFFEGMIGNVHILFLQSTKEPVPSVAKKHEHALQQHWDGPVAFAFDRITPRTRQRMVSEGLSFVVPRSQIYLPLLGMNLRERYKTRTQRVDRLRPSAQVLFLSLLTMPLPATNTPSVFAKQLGYTPMAMGQALDQLDDAELVRVHKAGRERLFELAGEPAEIWLKAQSVLASPVKRKRYLVGTAEQISEGLACGLSALANYSAIAEPRVPGVALISARTKNLLETRGVLELPSVVEADLEVEVWTYAPGLLSNGPTVDCLSLYLSLRDDQDERVQSALEEMMRGVKW
ncbi:MAG: hypothetical protein Q7J82_00210 [Coriobacteriia bacterium]|nr:hypothetical protein [Coriobacteriia bacterium]